MNKTMTLTLPTEAYTVEVGEKMAECVKPGLVLTFRGEIGAGKTTLIRAMLRAMGVESAIKSPTFSIVESYEIRDLHIHHFDLYRIHHEDELEYIGMRDYFTEDAVCCIEWPEHGAGFFEQVDVELTLTTRDLGRVLQVAAKTLNGVKILNCLEARL